MSEIINCHSHIFNIDNAPKKFLQGFTAKIIAKIAWPILNVKPGAYLLIKIIKNFVKDPHTKKLASFLKVGTMKSQNKIFTDLKNNYNAGDRFVVLTLNMDYMGAGKAKFPYNEQIHEIKRIKAQNLETCLPFYSVDPRAGNGNQLKEIAETHIKDKGFNGIKIYPALGFYPFDPKLEEMYKWATENKIPITTHCTRVGSYYLGKITQEMTNPESFYSGSLKNWPDKFGKPEFPIVKDLNDNTKFCDNFSEIYNYAIVLHKFEKLKLCFAHSGGDDEILLSHGANPDKSWFAQIIYLMKKYDNVYTDISYTIYEKKIFPDILKLLQDKKIGHKVLFGTDYFMTLRENSEKQLISKFRTFLAQNSVEEDLWKKITTDNPKLFLFSNYYSA